MEIILASGSPRRKELLTQIGVKDYRVLVSDVDEDIDRDMPPDQMVEELSRRKAEAVRVALADLMDSGILAIYSVIFSAEDFRPLQGRGLPPSQPFPSTTQRDPLAMK